ncbi:MAG: response-associated peptidase [Moraxellaceae bacterium]|jgi:putative SOS response-associated peptidase YedK|nr:response-associated peptidase [Moraxellaceae bacterium]
MCNVYVPASATDLARQFGVAVQRQYHPHEIYPRAPGWFIRRDREAAGYARELVQGQWGLIPWFAKTPKLTYATNNARAEELEQKASYKQPWARSQRCLIPVDHFWEPCWETGKNVWWRFRRQDGDAFALAGLWNAWVDKESGEVHESYTMLTLNADAHPVFRRMHKPDPKLPKEAQDKRMVVVLEKDAWDQWLEAKPELARGLIKRAPVSVFIAEPDPEKGSRRS